MRKEALFEEGVLSEIIAEVAFGLTKSTKHYVRAESTATTKSQVQQKLSEEREEEQRKRLLETKRKMLDAMGNTKMANVLKEQSHFLLEALGINSGTQPDGRKDPNDAGIDISGLFSLAGQKWNALK